VPTSVPAVVFSDQRLANGLRVIVAEDHLAPVVAINVWYDVGSKHEAPGKTGFAHLFEHVMFQGSRHVGKAEHVALVQAAGGTMNGSTWLDRTNYYETLPAHRMELGLWLEADRMATLLDALSQENLDNQREVVKNEKRWSYDNRPYGSWQEKLQAHLFPPEHPYHHSTIGSMDDLDAASLEDVRTFFRTYYAPNNAVLSVVGDVETADVRAAAERYFGRIPANPNVPPLGDLSLPPTLGGERRETVYDRVPLPRVHIAFRAPVFGDPRLDALEMAGQILAGGKGSRLNRRLVREERIAQDVALFTLGFIGGASVCAGWATVRPGVDVARVEAAFHEEIGRLATDLVSDDELARAKALTEADELGSLQRVEERADRLSMFATLFDHPAMINTMLPRYLAVTPEAIREAASDVFRADNRLVLTYLPEGPAAGDIALPEPADDAADEEEEAA
jgi:predicted Zn-dependent peptidase